MEWDLIIRTEYEEDRHDYLDDKNYIRQPTIGQKQNPYFDQRFSRPYHQRTAEDLQPSA